MKINSTKVKEVVNRVFQYGTRFVEENGKGLALNALAQFLDVPMQYSYRKPLTEQFVAAMNYPRNSSETAIDALLATGKTQYFDSDKETTAKEIYKVAKDGDDATHRYAILAIRELSKTCWSSSTKTHMNQLITNLATERGEQQ